MKIEVLEYSENVRASRVVFTMTVRSPSGERLSAEIVTDEYSLRSGVASRAHIKRHLKDQMRRALADSMEFVL